MTKLWNCIWSIKTWAKNIWNCIWSIKTWAKNIWNWIWCLLILKKNLKLYLILEITLCWGLFKSPVRNHEHPPRPQLRHYQPNHVQSNMPLIATTHIMFDVQLHTIHQVSSQEPSTSFKRLCKHNLFLCQYLSELSLFYV